MQIKTMSSQISHGRPASSPMRRSRALLGIAAVTLAAAACSAAPQATTGTARRSATGTAPRTTTHPATGSTPAVQAAERPYLLRFHTISQISTTVPANGDVNPYGIAVVPHTVGGLVQGDTLVSNFNNKANVQGTGTSIVEISPAGAVRPFARLGTLPSSDPCPGGIGLTTGLVVLPGGWVSWAVCPRSTGAPCLPAVLSAA